MTDWKNNSEVYKEEMKRLKLEQKKQKSLIDFYDSQSKLEDDYNKKQKKQSNKSGWDGFGIIMVVIVIFGLMAMTS